MSKNQTKQQSVSKFNEKKNISTEKKIWMSKIHERQLDVLIKSLKNIEISYEKKI